MSAWQAIGFMGSLQNRGYKIANRLKCGDAMKIANFYDPTRAIYDSGADYLTREKYRLVVIANSAWGYC